MTGAMHFLHRHPAGWQMTATAFEKALTRHENRSLVNR